MIFDKIGKNRREKAAAELLRKGNFHNRDIEGTKLKSRAAAVVTRNEKIDYGQKLVRYLEEHKDNGIEVVKVYGLYSYFKEDKTLNKKEIEKMVYLNLDLDTSSN